MFSIRTKFIISFGSLMLVIILVFGLVLLNSKAKEFTLDISEQTQAFAKFSAPEFFGAYEAYLEPGNFIAFQREVRALLSDVKHISGLDLYSYKGDLLYDSLAEQTELYSGAVRSVKDEALLERLKSPMISLALSDGSVAYIPYGAEISDTYVDVNEKMLETSLEKVQILNIVVPFDYSYAAFYHVDYSELNARLAEARIQISVFAILGSLLSLVLSFVFSATITNPLKALKDGALRIARGDFGARVQVKTRDELGLLADTFNSMAKDLGKSTEAIIYKERIKKELDLAAKIQNDLLPEDKLILKNLDFAGGLVPASEIGGDAFDYIAMKDGRYLTYLGDVTGHGVPAGIISSIANAVLYGMRDESNLSTIAQKLNAVLQDKTSDELFMTMALTLWDEESRTLNYVNAGHLPLLFYSGKSQELSLLKSPGIAFGLFKGHEWKVEEKSFVLAPNDVIVLVSDGIPEAVNAKNEQYGMDRLRAIVLEGARDLYSAEGIKNAILSDVYQFMGEALQADDITVLVMKCK